MMEPLTLTVLFDVGRLAPNRLRRLHWGERARLAKAAREAGFLAWREAGSPVSWHPVSVDLTLRRATRLDPDNALSAGKSLLDGIFSGNLTPNDSADWITGYTVHQETHRVYRGAESVVVRIRPQLAAAATEGGCAAALLEIED